METRLNEQCGVNVDTKMIQRIKFRKSVPGYCILHVPCGFQVVQVYLSWPNATVPVPILQLVGFQRVNIPKENTKTLVFVLTSKHMAVWLDSDKGFQVQKGIPFLLHKDMLT